MIIHGAAIYVLWLRELKRFARAKSRVVGALAMPLFFLAFLGLGFRKMMIPGVSEGVGYVTFLVPGILGMSLLFGLCGSSPLGSFSLSSPSLLTEAGNCLRGDRVTDLLLETVELFCLIKK